MDEGITDKELADDVRDYIKSLNRAITAAVQFGLTVKVDVEIARTKTIGREQIETPHVRGRITKEL